MTTVIAPPRTVTPDEVDCYIVDGIAQALQTGDLDAYNDWLAAYRERHPSPTAGIHVTVTTADYQAKGRLLGLTRHGDMPQVRVRGRDGLERRVALPARVTVT